MEEIQKRGTFTYQRRKDPIEIISEMCQISSVVFEIIMKKPQFTDLVRELNGTKYDLILYEPLFYSALLGFGKITGNPPVIGVGTINPPAFVDDPMGNPIIPSYIPQTMMPHSDHMTLYERFMNFYAELYMQYVMETCIFHKQQEYLEQVFGNVGCTTKDLEYNKSLLIVSTDWATMYPRPHQPNTIYVGPMHLTKPKPLPEDLKDWMDSARDGVIYFSLGSNMKGVSVPQHIRQMFIKAFQKFPDVRVLWKWELDTDLPGRPDNVLAKKWLPQQSILAHPKIRLFISQGGLQSLGEAIGSKVPILGVPIFGDQDFNMRKLVKEGAGRILEFTKLSYQDLYENIRTMLTNASYKENMERLYRITNDKPMSAMDTAIWWVEYVIRHKGAPHLRPASLDLSWYQIYMFDILGILIFMVLIVLSLVFVVIGLVTVSFNKGSKKSRSTNKKKLLKTN